MANIKIAQLTNQTAISDNDLIIVETATSTNKMTVGNLKSLLGIQSGGIVESGSNANGTYIKFGDGTMICTKSLSATVAVTSAWGSIFTSPDVTLGNFAMPFIAVPHVQISLGDGAGGFIDGLRSTTASSVGKCAISRANSTTQPFVINVLAIGKWK